MRVKKKLSFHRCCLTDYLDKHTAAFKQTRTPCFPLQLLNYNSENCFSTSYCIYSFVIYVHIYTTIYEFHVSCCNKFWIKSCTAWEKLMLSVSIFQNRWPSQKIYPLPLRGKYVNFHFKQSWQNLTVIIRRDLQVCQALKFALTWSNENKYMHEWEWKEEWEFSR